MPAERITMHKIREVLRLRFDFKLSYNKIAQSCHLGRSKVGDYIQRIEKSSNFLERPVSLESILNWGGISLTQNAPEAHKSAVYGFEVRNLKFPNLLKLK